ncbi:glutamine amidotransferase [Sphingomonas sp. CGMCC 1.13654]|uniref:Glutamine amidotransferase n=1 Tax=Sphingomonas chungangi TaxID=2683589 RepID=A0A838L5K8_9SPHN|nr:glutamine amidotransferase [Sphingomonas chungangi]MVW57251.1 glutamine amidotransferase [Sphingomonas chungangi]
MRALVVHHVAHEGLAAFAGPLAERGYDIEYLFVTDPDFAAIDFLEPDLLILLGGSMGVYERAANPWIDGELARIAMRIAAGGPTLGVCLGAQLIAAALGAEVKPGPIREVGFAPVTLTGAGKASPLAALTGVPILHWHGDGFTVPEGATLLAETAHFPQAFALGDTVLALQCHPEMGAPDDGIDIWLAEDADYVIGAETTEVAIRTDRAVLGEAAARAGQTMLRDWIANLP